jgi:cyclopropane-fatty-acyl-phospholipid synthase
MSLTARFRADAEQRLADVGITMNGPEPHDIQVHDDRLFRRVLLEGTLGLGESYMDGWWDCERVDEFICRVKHLEPVVGKGWTGVWNDVRSRLINIQTKRRARKVAEEHYDFGNELFEATLGPTMGYTCGYWRDASNGDEAQRHKFELICRKLGLREGSRLLEIGCGWGELLRTAAADFGARAVGVTNSREQVPAIEARCRGLPVEIVLSDYRDLSFRAEFDAVAVVGMIEHVGYRNHRAIMEVVHRALRPGGLFLLHTIGNRTTNLIAEPWIQKYIFPNGLTPSERQIAIAKEGLFSTQDFHNFGLDYDPTLLAWWHNFEANWDELRRRYPDKYDERFYRMWRFYLLSCAGGFRAGGPQLWQYVFSKGTPAEVYRSVR